MLRIARALGFLAPIAVAIFITVVLSTSPTATGAARDLQLLLAALALVAGMTSMALACWSYIGWRLNRIARALEDTLDTDLPVQLHESGIPAERRLARAFNAAAGAFLQVEARATHDRLTGVANRETLLTTLVAEVERAARHHSWLSVAFIDIDRFKPINDTYGHNSGDAVLRQVASLIADNIRASDLFGRYGGEEFMLILPETQHDEAVVLAEKLRNLVAQHRLVIAGNQHVQATISIGVAGDIGSQLQVDALVDQADAAMYAAKSLGRNRTYLFRAVDESAPVRRAPISADHRAAATAIGRWASDTATEALASVLAPAAAPSRPAIGHDRVARDRHRPGDGAARATRSSASGSPACCTTSASWRCRRRSWTSPPPCPTASGRPSASTRASARSSWSRPPACARRSRWCSITTSASTAAAIRTACAATRSRWAPASWPWPTPTTPWSTTGRTRRRGTTSRR